VTDPSTPPRLPRTQQARRRAALRLATWLCDHPAAARRAAFTTDPLTADEGDPDPAVPALDAVLREARALARSAPGRDLVCSQAGPGGLVVLAHTPSWSLVARSGGPVLVLARTGRQPRRVQTGGDGDEEVAAVVADLITASRGRPVR
jgi:hypothetical protein